MRNPFRRRKAAPARRGSIYQIGRPSNVAAKHDAFKRELAQIEAGPQALTAAGQHVVNGQASLLRRLVQPWQIRSFGYYDLLGEIKFSAQFYSRSLSNLRLYAAYRDEHGEVVELDPNAEDANGAKIPVDENGMLAIEALDRIRDPGGGGRSGLLGAYGRLMFLTGETYLFVSVNPETGLEQWEMLSTDEIRLNDGLYTRFKAPSLPANQFQPAPDDQFVLVGYHPDASMEQRVVAAEEGVAEAIAYRLWRRHPRFSDLADATMEGVLTLCEELVLLTAAVRARARSRLAGSGVLFLDDRIGQTPDEVVADEDPLEDPFIADLAEAMTSPIIDEGTASAVVPLVARVKVPDGMKLSDLVYHLQIIDPTQLYPETGLRMECIRRIAIGLDMPAEILLGLQDSNHWSAWQVDEQSWKAHLQPVAQQLVEDLTSAYLGPYLKSIGVEDWERYVIAYDASAVINHPDRTKDAKDLFDRRAIGKQALRDAAGFDDDDEMPKDELAESIGVATRDASLAWFGTPTVRGGNVETAPGEIVGPDQGDGGAGTGAEVEKGPPKNPVEAPPAEDVIGAAMMAARIEGAAHLAILRAREAAGAKIRTAARRDDEILAEIDGVSARDVAPTLGAAKVRALINGPREVDLVASARPLIIDALESVGVTDESVAIAIADTVEKMAAQGLYTPRVTLNGTFSQYVKGLLSTQKKG